MRYSKEVESLSAQIDRDEEKYSASEHLERQIMMNIPQRGFAVACQRVRLLAEKQALAERIRRNKIMLEWARD